MMASFYLELLAKNRSFYCGDCISLSLPVSDGSMGIMAHHSPMAAVLGCGELHCILPDDKELHLAVDGGFMKVENNRVTVLAESLSETELGK